MAVPTHRNEKKHARKQRAAPQYRGVPLQAGGVELGRLPFASEGSRSSPDRVFPLLRGFPEDTQEDSDYFDFENDLEEFYGFE